jgi:CHAD domain-containing protein
VEHGAVEREVKLEAGIGFRIPELDGVALGVTARPEPEQRLQAVYVDTVDLRLIRGGITLRHRSERRPGAPPGEWTLKLPEKSASPGLSRREINWPGPGGAVPAEVAGLVRAYRRTAPLGPVARLVTHRRRTVLCGRSSEPLLEIDDDVVSVMDGRRLAARFREVEVEVVGAAPDYLLEAVVARLAEAGAIAGDARSKVVRAIGPRATEPPDVTPIAIDRHSSIGEVVRAAIATGYLRLVAHDLGVRLNEDPEDVHQARVATRRLRSDLRTFRAYLPEDWDREIRTELGWVAEALGRARDADVLFERLHGQVDSLDRRDAEAAGVLLGRLVAEQGAARDALLKVLNTERYGVLLDRLAAAAQELPPIKAPDEGREASVPVADHPDPPGHLDPAGQLDPAGHPEPGDEPVGVDGGPDPAAAAGPDDEPAPSQAAVAVAVPAEPAVADRAVPARHEAPGIVRGPWRHLSRAVHALGPEPSDDALHEVRIRAKRLRYASEAVAPAVGKPAVTLAGAAAGLQGVLGDFHDAIVAEDWLRAGSADASPAEALAAGQLIARERDDAAQCRTTWKGAWKRLDHRKQRAWLG